MPANHNDYIDDDFMKPQEWSNYMSHLLVNEDFDVGLRKSLSV